MVEALKGREGQWQVSHTHTQILGYNADSHSYRPEKERKKPTQKTHKVNALHTLKEADLHMVSGQK